MARYSALKAEPTAEQKDLLARTIKIQFPKRIRTVGEAIRFLLQGSGYRLADSTGAGPEVRSLLLFPLPKAHRNLGPMSLRTALHTLAGPAFRLVEDPLHRRIAFEPCLIRDPSTPGPARTATQPEHRSTVDQAPASAWPPIDI